MIPKTIHLCWISGDGYPGLIRNCINTWHRALSDYEIRLWDAKSIDLARNAWVRQAFEARKYAFVTDPTDVKQKVNSFINLS